LLFFGNPLTQESRTIPELDTFKAASFSAKNGASAGLAARGVAALIGAAAISDQRVDHRHHRPRGSVTRPGF